MISIIIPTLNEESVLRGTLQQLQRLSSIPFEIIISDGQSQDKTLEIAASFGAKIVRHQGEKRQTISEARNLGAKLAHGDYLVFIDADTFIPDPDNFFQNLLRSFQQDKNLVGVTVEIHVLKELRTILDKVLFSLLNGLHWLNNNVLKRGSASGEFQMVRTETFRSIGGFNEELVAYEDMELFERLARIGRTRLLRNERVYHTGRRAHQVGHIRLLFLWLGNALWFHLFRKSYSKEWTPIR
jgi:glycosyltransferase involved in cell wall biosynthesis